MGRGDRRRAAARLSILIALGACPAPDHPHDAPAIAVFERDGVLRWATTDGERLGDLEPQLRAPVASGALPDRGAWVVATANGEPVLALLHRDRAGVAATVFHAPSNLRVESDGIHATGSCVDGAPCCTYDLTATGLATPRPHDGCAAAPPRPARVVHLAGADVDVLAWLP